MKHCPLCRGAIVDEYPLPTLEGTLLWVCLGCYMLIDVRRAIARRWTPA